MISSIKSFFEEKTAPVTTAWKGLTPGQETRVNVILGLALAALCAGVAYLGIHNMQVEGAKGYWTEWTDAHWGTLTFVSTTNGTTMWHNLCFLVAPGVLGGLGCLFKTSLIYARHCERESEKRQNTIPRFEYDADPTNPFSMNT